MEQQTILADHDRQFSWSDYNKSQTREKELLVWILTDLCGLVQEPVHDKGRKPSRLRDVIFALVLKEYLNTSSRRLQSDLKLFEEAGFTKAIPFNTLLDNLERAELRASLSELIEISSLPLRKIELDFAIDGTGFSTSRYTTYFDVKHKRNARWRQFRKCHAVCGVKTNIVTAVEITDGSVHDYTQFEKLSEDTARNFKIRKFLADKGYLSKRAFSKIDELGGKAFIPFKTNSNPKSRSKGTSKLWKDMYRMFKEEPETFNANYYLRSNIESTFSMIKRKFGNNVKCKKEKSQDNEILGKILAHNICVLVQEVYLNKITTEFNKEKRSYVGNG